MYLNFIGTGSAFNTELGNNSAYQIYGKHLFLIDCGGTVFDRLTKSGILDIIENATILITHLHPDHIGSLGDLIFYMHFVKKKNATIVYPEIDHLVELLGMMGVEEEYFNYDYTLLDGNYRLVSHKFEIGNTILDISPIEVNHQIGMAYYITNTSNDLTAYYSGDCNNIPKQVIEDLESSRYRYLDVLYQDTTSLDYEGNIHLSLNKLEQLIKPEFRHQVFCMHLDSKFNPFKAKSLGFQVAKNIFQK
jgi:ribonuclease BN (tRNA processing enzyme)